MPTKESQITYQSHSVTPCLKQLVDLFGDRLEGLTALDKLDLIAILALWQSRDTEGLQNGLAPILLTEYVKLNRDLQASTSQEVDDALLALGDCSDEDAITLLVSLPCQLRDGVFAE